MSAADAQISAPLILALDYPGRRPEARISDLKLQDAGFDVVYLMSGSLPQTGATAEYLSVLMDQACVADPKRAVAVLAYCAASTLAHDLAAAHGIGLAVLFDSEPMTTIGVAKQFVAVARGISPEISIPSWCPPAVADDSLLTLMRGELADLVQSAMCDGDEHSDTIGMARETVLETCMDWMTHLVAACAAELPPWPGEVVHVASRDHQLTWQKWPGVASTTTFRVEVDRAGLLANELTRKKVLEILEARLDATGHQKQ